MTWLCSFVVYSSSNVPDCLQCYEDFENGTKPDEELEMTLDNRMAEESWMHADRSVGWSVVVAFHQAVVRSNDWPIHLAGNELPPSSPTHHYPV